MVKVAQKSQILHVAVDKATERLLREQAKRENESLSIVLRRAIKSYLAGSPDIQSEVVPEEAA